MFEVTTINYVVGFIVVSIEHIRFRVSSSSSATLRVEVVRKRDSKVGNKWKMSHFLLHNERINATNARNEIHGQDLCANVGIRITQSFEEVRNIFHVLVFANIFGKIANAWYLARTCEGLVRSPSSSHRVLSLVKY